MNTRETSSLYEIRAALQSLPNLNTHYTTHPRKERPIKPCQSEPAYDSPKNPPTPNTSLHISFADQKVCNHHRTVNADQKPITVDDDTPSHGTC